MGVTWTLDGRDLDVTWTLLSPHWTLLRQRWTLLRLRSTLLRQRDLNLSTSHVDPGGRVWLRVWRQSLAANLRGKDEDVVANSEADLLSQREWPLGDPIVVATEALAAHDTALRRGRHSPPPPCASQVGDLIVSSTQVRAQGEGPRQGRGLGTKMGGATTVRGLRGDSSKWR